MLGLKSLQRIIFPRQQRAWSLHTGTSGFDWEVTDGRNSSVVMAPVQWILRSFPEAPLTVDRFQSGSWEQEIDHPMLELWQRPNPFMTGELMEQAILASLIFDGNAFLLKRGDSQLRTDELWWTPPDLMTPKWPKDGSEWISYWEYKPGNGDPVPMLPSDIIHFKWGMDPDNPRLGISPLKSVFREIFTDEETARMGAALVKNMGIPGLMISPKGDQAVGDDDLDATELAIRTKFTGDRRGEPLVSGTPTEVTMFGFSPQQMDMRTLRRVPEERVSANLGVPAIVAGLGAGLDRSTFANFAEAREAGTENCLVPLWRIISSELRHQLLPDFEPNVKVVRPRYDITEVRTLQEDQNAKVERTLKEVNAGVITVGEYRRETGREADATHDVYLRAMNLEEVRAEDLGKEPEPVPAQLPITDNPAAPDNQPPELDLVTGLPIVGKMKSKAQGARLMRMFIRSEAKLSKKFSAQLGSTFDDIGQAVASAYRANPPKTLKVEGDDLPSRRDIDRIVTSAKINRFIDVMVKQYKDHYQLVSHTTTEIVNDIYGLNVDLPDTRARAILAQGGKRVGLIDMTQQTKDAVFRALVDGRTLGEGVDALARRVRHEVAAGRYSGAGPKYRAQLIARTETKYAQNISAMEAYKEANASGCLAFDAQGSGDSDAECQARDGETFSFADAEVELESEHPNGTLSFAPVF